MHCVTSESEATRSVVLCHIVSVVIIICKGVCLHAFLCQKRALGSPQLELGTDKPLYGRWEPDLVPLQEQVLLPTEPSLNCIQSC